MDGALYREVVERIRSSGTDVLINLTTGPGARFEHDPDDPTKASPASTLRGPDDRVRHVQELRPDICSLDMGSLNMGNRVFINTPAHLQTMAAAIREAGVLPELEVFETGHLLLAKKFIEAGLRQGAGHVPDLPRHRLGPAGDAGSHDVHAQPAAGRARPGLPSASRCTSSRWWRRRSCSAAMCGSGWRTISIWRRASSRRATRRWSRRPAASSRQLGDQCRDAERGAGDFGAARRRGTKRVATIDAQRRVSTGMHVWSTRTAETCDAETTAAITQSGAMPSLRRERHDAAAARAALGGGRDIDLVRSRD